MEKIQKGESMSEAKFKTMRHIETVRNYLNEMVRELLKRAEEHDQSKMDHPEVETFEVYTHKLRDMTYGSDEYKKCLREMRPTIDHHNSVNRHHPEHFTTGISEMTLIDLIEMICDWKAAGMRHNDGDLIKSITINKDRFGIDAQLYQILMSTAEWINGLSVKHKANES
jgi:hypothetical protein